MLWLCYTEPRREADVQEQCMAIGVKSWIASRATFKQIGTERRAQLVYELDFPRVIVLEMNDHQFQAVSDRVRYLNPTKQMVGKASAKDILRYRRELDASNAEALRLDAATEGRRKLISAFSEGQSLEITKGPLTGLFARFQKMVERPTDPHPMAVVEGPLGAMKIDPLHLKAGE